MSWPAGDYYEGSFKKGRANGKGLFSTSHGVHYTGDFINDELVYGKRTSKDCREIYEGSFHNNMAEGQGYLLVVDEFEYRGMFKNNMMEGQGSISYFDGSHYEGNFRLGKKHGFGRYTHPNGQFYDGLWVDGDLRTMVDNKERLGIELMV